MYTTKNMLIYIAHTINLNVFHLATNNSVTRKNQVEHTKSILFCFKFFYENQLPKKDKDTNKKLI